MIFFIKIHWTDFQYKKKLLCEDYYSHIFNKEAKTAGVLQFHNIASDAREIKKVHTTVSFICLMYPHIVYYYYVALSIKTHH